MRFLNRSVAFVAGFLTLTACGDDDATAVDAAAPADASSDGAVLRDAALDASAEADASPDGGSIVPRGSDFGLTARWTVDGEPPNEASCASADVVEVSLRFVDAGRTEGDSELRGPCASGTFNTSQKFASGSYTLQWFFLGMDETFRSGDRIELVATVASSLNVQTDIR